MPRSRFSCSLHSCQANDGLFSGTNSKTAAAAKPCHNRTPNTGPCQVLRLPALLQELFFCSASLPHHMLCLMGSQSCHRKARRALLQCYQCTTLLEFPALGTGDTPLSSCQVQLLPVHSWGVWALTWAGPFQGHCGPAWRDRQVTCSAKGSDRWKKPLSFTLNNQYEVHVHPGLLLFATSYRSSTLRPQMSFRLVESLFTSAGFGSDPS